ncbi:putative quinol monooxygenase [Conexibacter sp. CPCC 206217]|uniref:putative quinol monooxygenase n=1 Tax=Conexibacter sp. CPCC 206217 TaxID=3064574 RepID=UPI002718724E|nr:putative quinol monooxygenase [Conexibacter sp. CPCC 206217]MDO8212645.1 putative quinol monooxygenase [Conexibacter sp. CPCC 206217]
MSDARVILEAVLHGLGGRAAELDALLAELATASRTEPGCHAFRIATGDEPGDVAVVSFYADEAALRAHYATPHYRRYRAQVGQLLARPSDVIVYHVNGAVRAQDPNLPDPDKLG